MKGKFLSLVEERKSLQRMIQVLKNRLHGFEERLIEINKELDDKNE